MTVLAYLAFAAALLPGLIVPGWLWLRRAGVAPVQALYGGLGATVAYAGATVGVAQLLPWSAPTTCKGAFVLAALIAAYCAATAPKPLLPSRGDLAGLAIFAVAFLALAAYSGVPSRPAAVWADFTVGPDRIETPKWPGQSTDNVLPFRTGQLALNKVGGDQLTTGYSRGWFITDRTPLTGLTFAYAAGAAGVDVPADDPTLRPPPEVRPSVQDRYGFWAYQLVGMLLNAAVILGAFLLARTLFDHRVATAAAALTALMPGLFLNEIYTWPKPALAYFVLCAAAYATVRRMILAGAFAALGYLCHPAGAFWLPGLLALGLAARPLAAASAANAVARLRPALAFLVPAFLLALPWQLFGSQVVGASSRLLTSPFGYQMADPTRPGHELGLAWDRFNENGLGFALWERVSSTWFSVFPTVPGSLPIEPDGGIEGPLIMVWYQAHGLPIWGIAGFVVLPLALLGTVRRWPALRGIVLWLVVPSFVLAWLFNGFAFPFATQSLFPLVGLLAIPAAVAALELRRRARTVWVVLLAAEFASLAYWSLLRPVAISPGAITVFVTLAVLGHLALLAALVASVRGGQASSALAASSPSRTL